MLSIDSVELWPTAVLLPWLWEREHSIPNPIAYIPQYALDYSTHMVRCFHAPFCQAVCQAVVCYSSNCNLPAAVDFSKNSQECTEDIDRVLS